MTWMIATYPNQTADEAVQKCWKADWSEVVVKYGGEVLTECLKRHRKASSFLPTRHDLDVQLEVVLGTVSSSAQAHRKGRTATRVSRWRMSMKMRGRDVTLDEARESVRRLINSLFRNVDRARLSIPAEPSDDNLVITDCLHQQKMLAESNAALTERTATR